MSHSPTVRRRRLSLALLQFRDAAGLNSKEAAKQLGWQPSKLTRIERNEWRKPTIGDVMDMLDLYGVKDERTRTAMTQLVRESNRRGWWEEEFQGILGGALVGLEWEAAEINSFEIVVVPGLLQTEAYAAAVFRGGRVLREEEITRRVAARLARQRILTREDPPSLAVVIDEAALRKHVGGHTVMRDQLQHLRQLAEAPNISLQVLPDAVGAHASMEGNFTILNYRAPKDDPSIVYVGIGVAGDLYLEQPEDVAHYREMYGYLRASALSAVDSVSYIEELIRHLK
ncbi:helix-turn-helix domain-containing protein [Sphaerisporangium aureirubrum]|uniref:Helix-turn-helix domain-containing protein n=1 Tax=Sphaerisporangium aureirubrum TaxID=1544736 RepID=A0ABW1NCU8_9ACTN